ncbi:MAG: Trk system potassium transporter TrkA [Bacteroidaceae bacterium]|nr:Trk system potassium transporter TrkA [Bacteroidaceae bacterium]
MNIIIAGAGAVGTHLARLLAREQHKITILDESPKKLEGLNANMYIMTLVASPTSINDLRNADAGKADLFIGVTPDEARNLTSCMLASRLGAKKTVARVDNSEYVTTEFCQFFKGVGINSLVYPEMLAGLEISHDLNRSWVRQWWEFQNGQLIILGVKIRDNSQIANLQLKDFCRPATPYIIVALKHGNETIIPRGNTTITPGDIVYFMTMPEHIEFIKEVAGKVGYKEVKNVMLLGGSSTAIHTIKNLPKHVNIKVFETDPVRVEELADMFIDDIDNGRLTLLQADGRDIGLLQDENIAHTQAFVATTENAETNILACLAAKRMGVQKTVAMVENSDYISMAESLEIGTIINKKTFAASHIYQMLLKADVESLKSLTIANADVAEIKVHKGSKVTKHLVRDLHLPPNTTLGGFVRNGKCELINGNTQLQEGDKVVAFCIEDGIHKLEKFFSTRSFIGDLLG